MKEGEGQTVWRRVGPVNSANQHNWRVNQLDGGSSAELIGDAIHRLSTDRTDVLRAWLNLNIHIYIYIYIYTCVCVC